ncbi:MAG: hypothetical protein BRC58_11090 [Cyanobacteria bacterium QS_8_64_29]|nr:MAG: hypothetical protein BRC58_11090 [Cyanobacteria bacterium QS_8_64_29]
MAVVAPLLAQSHQPDRATLEAAFQRYERYRRPWVIEVQRAIAQTLSFESQPARRTRFQKLFGRNIEQELTAALG